MNAPDRCDCKDCLRLRFVLGGRYQLIERIGEAGGRRRRVFIRLRAGGGAVVFLTLSRSKGASVPTLADLTRAWERFRGVQP